MLVLKKRALFLVSVGPRRDAQLVIWIFGRKNGILPSVR